MRIDIRARVEHGCYCFTVNLAERGQNRLLVKHMDHLCGAFRYAQQRHPFSLDAIVVFPEHLHCLWHLPPQDDDFPTRWRLIKSRFSRRIAKSEKISASRLRKGERGIWQRRYWEHLVRDERDYYNHLDYIHFNPVKHGYVERVRDWPHSSFLRWVGRDAYPIDWAASDEVMGYEWDGLLGFVPQPSLRFASTRRPSQPCRRRSARSLRIGGALRWLAFLGCGSKRCQARGARRLLEQQRAQRALCVPQRERSWRPQQQSWLSLCPSSRRVG